MPGAADRIALPEWTGLKVEWLVREGVAPTPPEGKLMAAAAARASLPEMAQAGGEALAAVDLDREILWDRATPQAGRFYAWVAGESEAVLTIRRLLIKERGLDRRTANLMGYWRRGRALDDAA